MAFGSKRNKLLIQVATLVDLENNVLREINQAPKYKCCMIPPK